MDLMCDLKYIINGILDLGPNPDHWAEQNKDQLLDPSHKEMEGLEGLYQKAAGWVREKIN